MKKQPTPPTAPADRQGPGCIIYLLLFAIILVLATGCYHPRYGVAPAKITIGPKGVKVQPLQKLRPIKDTVIIGHIIKRIL